MTKFEKMFKVMGEWAKEKDVAFIGSFVSFDKEGEVDDNRMVAYGSKEILDISLKEIKDGIDKEDSKFINW